MNEQLILELHVSSLKRSIAFYRRLGFKLVRSERKFCVLAWGEHPLFLFEGRGARKTAHDNLRIIVPDVDAAWRKVRRARAKVLVELGDRYYGLRDFTIADPDGFGVRFGSFLKR